MKFDAAVVFVTKFLSFTEQLLWAKKNLIKKTSPKGFLAFKCDKGNWILSKNFGLEGEFFGNFLGGFFWRHFLGKNFLEDIFWENFFERIFWEDFFGGFFGRNCLDGLLCLHC